MELDDLKNTWEDINKQVGKKQHIQIGMIDRVTKTKYQSNMKKILYPEIAGAIVCLAAVIYIGINFGKLDSPFLQGTGVLTLVLLCVLPMLSLLSILQFHLNGDVNKPYAETLREFATQKIRFHKLQKINIILSYLLLVTTIFLMSKLFFGKDITGNIYFWTTSFTLGYVFLLCYSKWVWKYYKRNIRRNEELLKELVS